MSFTVAVNNTTQTTSLTVQNVTVTYSGASVVNGSFVASIAALKLVSGSVDGQVIQLNGYYAEGDGGGGEFFWNATSTTADNGGTIIAPTGVSTGRWYRIFDNIYRPTMFGAKGDGSTDDTTAVGNCFSACPAYGVIDFAGRNYMLTAPIARAAVGVTIRNGKIYLNNPSSFSIYALVANDYNIFENIYFLGTGAIGTTVTVTFTVSVGGATSGTLTSAIANATYLFIFSNGDSRQATVTGGTSVIWTGALTAGTVTTATYPGTPRYQGGIFGGDAGYAAPMNTAPANYVTVRGCTFTQLTVGVWSGGTSAVGWKVCYNKFINIVGTPGLSEGYGVILTPCSDSIVSDNSFKTIQRHAVYLAAGASNNIVTKNVIDGIDNIGIQVNTYATEPTSNNNSINGNILLNLTKSVAYGNNSSVGITIVGNNTNIVVSDNIIYTPLDIGIDIQGATSGTAYADNIVIEHNTIILTSTSGTAAISAEDLLSGSINGNIIKLSSSVEGILITSAFGSGSNPIFVTDNNISTTNTSSVAFRLNLGVPRIIRLFGNNLYGFTSNYVNILNDTSTSGTVRSDLNRRVGYVATDADFTHYSGGSVNPTDCYIIRHGGTLTAARTITLSDSNVDHGNTFKIVRTGGGAFNLNINTGNGTLMKALNTNQYAEFAFDVGGEWQEIAFGTL